MSKKIKPTIDAVKMRQQIWTMSLPFQDKRDDKGHAEIATKYALSILQRVDGADSDIVIPAIMLHDIGWSQLPEIQRMIVYTSKVDSTDTAKKIARYKHQVLGAELAYNILKKVGYPEDLIPEILLIISQHDTREGFFTLNDSIVRDTDKLWRYSQTGFGVFVRNRKLYKRQANERIDCLRKKIGEKGFFMLKESRGIAQKEIKKLVIPEWLEG